MSSFSMMLYFVKQKVKGFFGYALCVLAFVLVALPPVIGLPFRISPVFVVIGAAIAGVVRGLIMRKRGESK